VIAAGRPIISPEQEQRMSKKHFCKLAEAVRLLKGKVPEKYREDFIAALIAVCLEFNGRFEPSRFRKACGLPE
jgi:hypothetical protein